MQPEIISEVNNVYTIKIYDEQYVVYAPNPYTAIFKATQLYYQQDNQPTGA